MRLGQTKQPGSGSKVPLRKRIFDELRHEILRGELHDGERLIEIDIARRFGISRTPVREAFRKLEIEGLVGYVPGRGVAVNKNSTEDMDEIYSIRGVLEGLCARLAAQHITKTDIKRLRALLVEMNRLYELGDFRSSARLHTRFNDLLYRAASSPRLQELASRFNDYTERSQLRSMGVPDRYKAIAQEHEAIVSALEEGDPQKAEDAVRAHVEHARAAYRASVALWSL